MAVAYNTIDADGHILEPLDLWENYIDPKFRERRPRFAIDENGKERLTVEGKMLGNPRGIGSLGAVGVRQGTVKPDTLKYAEGKKGGFDPHARIVDMDADGIDAAFLIRASACSPVPSRTLGSPARCAAPTTGGWPITASLIRIACSVLRCFRCSRLISRLTRCALPGRSSGCAAGSCGQTRITATR